MIDLLIDSGNLNSQNVQRYILIRKYDHTKLVLNGLRFKSDVLGYMTVMTAETCRGTLTIPS